MKRRGPGPQEGRATVSGSWGTRATDPAPGWSELMDSGRVRTRRGPGATTERPASVGPPLRHITPHPNVLLPLCPPAAHGLAAPSEQMHQSVFPARGESCRAPTDTQPWAWCGHRHGDSPEPLACLASFLVPPPPPPVCRPSSLAEAHGRWECSPRGSSPGPGAVDRPPGRCLLPVTRAPAAPAALGAASGRPRGAAPRWPHTQPRRRAPVGAARLHWHLLQRPEPTRGRAVRRRR